MNQQSQPFELILDDCVTAVLQKEAHPESYLQQYPAHQDALEPLLQLTLRLQKARAVQPDPEFMQGAAVRMQNMIAARPRQPQTAPKAIQSAPTLWQKLADYFAPQRQLAWVRVLAVVCFVFLALGTTTVLAANDALPGQRLYPVKQFVENTQLSFTFSPVSRAQYHLNLAERRLEETAVLLDTNHTTEIANSLADYQAEIETAVAYLGERDELTIQEKETFARAVAANLADHEMQLLAWESELPIVPEVVIQALQTAQEGRDFALALLEEVVDELPPVLTATPTSVPTSTPEPATPTPVWELPPFWPPGCPSPLEWPDEWPENCTIPDEWLPDWPEPPGGWPIPTLPLGTIEPLASWTPPPYWPPECPVPQEWLFTWPEDCVLPTGYPPDWTPPPGGWPDIDIETPLPNPTVRVPPNWPEECPLPEDWFDGWQGWPEDCEIPTDFEWPEDWPPPPEGWPEIPSLDELDDLLDDLPPLPTAVPDLPDDLPPPGDWPIPPPDDDNEPPPWPWP